jgi:hypothetical protein
VFFLGFPLSLYTDVEALNNGYPLAFVKKGICAGIFGNGPEQILYVDAMNTKGFSGGPLLCPMENGELGVIGAISGYARRVVKAPVGEGPQSARPKISEFRIGATNFVSDPDNFSENGANVQLPAAKAKVTFPAS